jgi:hypothetical protein
MRGISRAMRPSITRGNRHRWAILRHHRGAIVETARGADCVSDGGRRRGDLLHKCRRSFRPSGRWHEGAKRVVAAVIHDLVSPS